MLARAPLSLALRARAPLRRGLSVEAKHAKADAESAERIAAASGKGALSRYKVPIVNTLLSALAFGMAARSHKAQTDMEEAREQEQKATQQLEAFKHRLRDRDWAETTVQHMGGGDADELHYQIRHLIGDAVAVRAAKKAKAEAAPVARPSGIV